MYFAFRTLFDLGLGIGAGAAAVSAPFVTAFAVWDKWSERRIRANRAKAASRRRPPSISGNTEELPRITDGDIIKRRLSDR
jgi:hypothetical protein